MHLYIYTASHKSEYTPHISAIILVYPFKGQYYRNETCIYFKVVNVQLDLLSSENNFTYSHYCQKSWQQNEYTLSDNSYTSFNHAKPHVLFIMFMFLSTWQDHTHLCILF